MALWVTACAVGPNYVRPEPPAVDHYAEGTTDPALTPQAEGTAQRLERGGAVVGDWWKLFGSPQAQKSNRASRDLYAAKKLWETSEELTGVRYVF